MAVDVGNLLVRVGADISEMQRKLDVVEREVSKTSQAAARGAKLMDTAFKAAALAGVAIMAKRFVDMGAAIEETASKFNTVMGPAAERVQAVLDDFANTAGLTNKEAQNLVATSAAIAQGFGFAQDEAATLSTEILRLSADLGSFNNIPTEEVINAVNAALAGEREQLKRLGIVIREVDVQQRAMATTGKETAASLTQQEKATATLQLISERAGVAVGDLARTQDSLANQTKQAEARLRDTVDAMAAAVAQGIQVSGVVSELNDVLAELGGGTPARLVRGFFEGLGSILARIIQSFEETLIMVRRFGNVLRALDRVTIDGIQQTWQNVREEVGKTILEIRLSRSEFQRRRSEIEETADAEERVATAAARTADAVERAANAQRSVSFSMGPAQQSLNPGARSVSNGLCFDLAPLQIPEFIRHTEEMGEELDRAGFAMDAARQATGLLSGELGKLSGAVASGGVIGGLIAGLGSILDSAAEQRRRIDQARRDWEAALDAYVDELAAMDRIQRLQHDAIEGAKAALEALTRTLTAGIKSDKIREALERQFSDAIESLDLDMLEKLLAQFGPEGQAILDELQRRMEEINRLREEEAEEAERAAEAARKAAEEIRRAAEDELRRNRIVARDLALDEQVRRAELSGDERAALQARLNAEREREIRRLTELQVAGVITNEQWARMVALINDEVVAALDEFDAAARQAAQAAQEAAEAQRFQQMMDEENLRVRLLTMRGLEGEALALRQSLELLKAIEDKRSAEYIALLNQIHAEERAQLVRHRATESIARQTRAVEETKRAIDGVSRVLNGPAGFTFALARNRALRGDAFGVAASSPSFGGGSSVRVESGAIIVNAAPGQDPAAIADAVLDRLSGAADRRVRAGGFDPLTQRREGF